MFPRPGEAPSQVPTPSRPSQVCVCEEAQVQSGQAANLSDKARNCTGAHLSPSWAFPACCRTLCGGLCPPPQLPMSVDPQGGVLSMRRRS